MAALQACSQAFAVIALLPEIPDKFSFIPRAVFPRPFDCPRRQWPLAASCAGRNAFGLQPNGIHSLAQIQTHVFRFGPPSSGRASDFALLFALAIARQAGWW